MLRLHILVFHQHAIGVLGLMQDIHKKTLRDERKLEVAGITVIVADYVVHGIIRVERVIIALRIQ